MNTTKIRCEDLFLIFIFNLERKWRNKTQNANENLFLVYRSAAKSRFGQPSIKILEKLYCPQQKNFFWAMEWKGTAMEMVADITFEDYGSCIKWYLTILLNT